MLDPEKTAARQEDAAEDSTSGISAALHYLTAEAGRLGRQELAGLIRQAATQASIIESRHTS